MVRAFLTCAVAGQQGIVLCLLQPSSLQTGTCTDLILTGVGRRWAQEWEQADGGSDSAQHKAVSVVRETGGGSC